MTFLSYGIVVVIVSIIFVLYNKCKNDDKLNIILKYLAIILAIIFFIRYMSGSDAISEILALKSGAFDSKFSNFLSLMLNWFLNASIMIIIFNSFFKNDNLKNIIKFIIFPLSILMLVSIRIISIGIVGYFDYIQFNFRAILIAVEIGIVFSYSLIMLFQNSFFSIKKGKIYKLLYAIPMFLAIMPTYALQGLFGYANIAIEIKSLTLPHRIVIYLGLIIPVIIFIFLRNKSQETKKLVLLYISICTLVSFSLGHKFASFLDITAWPFHLCNTAMYIIPLCLVFKWDKLFYFTYFINVLGAFLAMAVPNYSSEANLFSTSLVNFYVNHYIAFFMPILMVALRIYKRPTLRTFIYSMVGFLIYFVLVLILNAWFSNYASVDYFFINSDFIADKLGLWAENLRNNTVEFNIGSLEFVFYPIYQTIFFIVYGFLGALMWFFYEWMYITVDSLYDIAEKRKKIKLDMLALQIALNGRSVEEPLEMNNLNKLTLKNFSKKYKNNDNYAVKNANLEIFGGEIFGFLGPNGAGKSTIIKSIVGIQPITDGSINVCGYDVDKQSVQAKKMIGFVPDHYALYEKLTGREYINYIADLYEVSKEDRDNRIKKYVKLFELENAFDNQMRTYSHGMKQKIAIMSALVHNPKVWILDEPLTGLDPNSIFQVKECMKEHARKGNIVFFSSHIIDVVERICDRIAIIKKGEIQICKKVSQIEENTTLEDFYMTTINSGKNQIKVKI